MKKIYLYAIVLWFLFSFLGVCNGIIRDLTYGTILNELFAHQLSTMILMIIFSLLIFFFFKRFEASEKRLWIIGAGWFLMTICFEFLAGHFLFGNSWNMLLNDYNVFSGRIWIFVLLTMLFGPKLFSRKRKRSS